MSVKQYLFLFGVLLSMQTQFASECNLYPDLSKNDEEPLSSILKRRVVDPSVDKVLFVPRAVENFGKQLFDYKIGVVSTVFLLRGMYKVYNHDLCICNGVDFVDSLYTFYYFKSIRLDRDFYIARSEYRTTSHNLNLFDSLYENNLKTLKVSGIKSAKIALLCGMSYLSYRFLLQPLYKYYFEEQDDKEKEIVEPVE